MFRIVVPLAAVGLILLAACGDATLEEPVSPTVVALVTITPSPTVTPVASSAAQPPVGPQTCGELVEALEPALGPTSKIVYCDDTKGVAVEYRSKSKTWAVYLLATSTIEDWRAKRDLSLQVLEQLEADPCSSFWTIVDPLKPDLQPGDMDPYGCGEK